MIEVTEKDNVTSNDRILKESDRINKIEIVLRIVAAGESEILHIVAVIRANVVVKLEDVESKSLTRELRAIGRMICGVIANDMPVAYHS